MGCFQWLLFFGTAVCGFACFCSCVLAVRRCWSVAVRTAVLLSGVFLLAVGRSFFGAVVLCPGSAVLWFRWFVSVSSAAA